MNCKNCGLPIEKASPYVRAISGYMHSGKDSLRIPMRTCEYANDDIGSPKYKHPKGTTQYGQVCEFMLAEPGEFTPKEHATVKEVLFQQVSQVAVEETGRKFRITP